MYILTCRRKRHFLFFSPFLASAFFVPFLASWARTKTKKKNARRKRIKNAPGARGARGSCSKTELKTIQKRYRNEEQMLWPGKCSFQGRLGGGSTMETKTNKKWSLKTKKKWSIFLHFHRFVPSDENEMKTKFPFLSATKYIYIYKHRCEYGQ